MSPRRRPWALALLCALGLAWGPRAGATAGLELEVARLAHPALALEGLTIALGAEGESAELSIARLTVGARHWRALSLRCADFRLADGVVRCRGGALNAPGLVERASVDAHFDVAAKTARLHLRTPAGEAIRVAALHDGRLRLELSGVTVARLADWFPQLAAYQPGGRLDGHIDYHATSTGAGLALSGRLTGGAFASADGLQAGEELALEFGAQATAHGPGWTWQGRIAWTGGEAYLHPLYHTAGPTLEAVGTLDGDTLAVSHAALGLEGVRTLSANGAIDLGQRRLRRAALTVAQADLAVIGPRYLAPALLPARAEALRFAGRVSAGIEFESGALTALDLVAEDAGFSLFDDGLSFGPVSGVLPWRAHSPTEARLEVGGGRWQKLALGPFALAARLDGSSVAVERVAVPVLDGALVLDRLALRHEADGWYGSGAVVVEPISMNRLAEALGLPVMSGVLAASMPGLRVAPGRIGLDGALVISVFDGYVQATGLQVREPFGVASHLSADVEARHIDLAQLTEAFAFGSITGFIDADLRGLELARWRPVRFDARVASSPGRYPRRISQRAVQNIGALGGAGAVAAIQRGFLGFFDSFGYREIGVSCVLAGGVCRMSGLEGAAPGGGFYLVRGGGIPALNVIGYNRRVDWNELVDRVQRVISSNTAPLIQ